MSSLSPAQNGMSPRELWSQAGPYLKPPVAAGVAIIPVFYGFIAKSAQQIDKPIPRMTVIDVLKEGSKAAPTIGVIVGTQMIVQNIAEKALKKNDKDKSELPFSSMLISSAIVGGISAPALAVFNGQTMGRTVMESLMSLSLKQGASIIFRETSFLFSLRISEPVSKIMKRTSGDNKSVEYISAFATGVIGSIIGHPADTALTRWQKGMKVENYRQLIKGSPVKAVAVGGFAVLYKLVTESFPS